MPRDLLFGFRRVLLLPVSFGRVGEGLGGSGWISSTLGDRGGVEVGGFECVLSYKEEFEDREEVVGVPRVVGSTIMGMGVGSRGISPSSSSFTSVSMGAARMAMRCSIGRGLGNSFPSSLSCRR